MPYLDFLTDEQITKVEKIANHMGVWNIDRIEAHLIITKLAYLDACAGDDEELKTESGLHFMYQHAEWDAQEVNPYRKIEMTALLQALSLVKQSPAIPVEQS